MNNDPYLDLDAVADLLGVGRQTLIQYRALSRPGKRYEHHPFPAPDRTFSRAPVWKADRAPELKQWAQSRPGQGTGGGRPPKTKEDSHATEID